MISYKNYYQIIRQENTTSVVDIANERDDATGNNNNNDKNINRSKMKTTFLKINKSNNRDTNNSDHATTGCWSLCGKKINNKYEEWEI